MAVSMLCSTFLVAIVAINQSFADSPSGNIPELHVNGGNQTVKEKLGSNFNVTCTVIALNESKYRLGWRMKDNITNKNETKTYRPLESPVWFTTSYLIFEHFKAEHKGTWTCELRSIPENELVHSGSVELFVDDQVSWKVEIENNRTEYRTKKGGNVTWTLIIKDTEPTDVFDVTWYSPPNRTKIEPAPKSTETKYPAQRSIKQNYTLSNVTVEGTYEVEVSNNKGENRTLPVKVSFKSDTSSTASKPTGPTTKRPLPSSGIRIESSFLAVVVAWFACRSVGFGTTARIY